MNSIVLSLLAALVSFACTALLIPRFIPLLKRLKMGQRVSEYALDEYKEKAVVPTMGGLFFVIIPIVVSVAFNFSSLDNKGYILVLLAYFGYGLIGFIDDLKIIIEKKNDGLKPLHKFLMQVFLAVVFYWMYTSYAKSTLILPFDITLELGILYAVLVLFMFAGSSNAVNLTDGMDGLAGGTSVLAYFPYLVFAYMRGEFAIMIFVSSIIGSLIGYLVYNLFPARIIMGDTGSLALGGGLAALSLVLKKEILLILIGGVFVFETVCVLIQQTSVRLFKKKVFKYTPIHYTFVLNGWKEKNVVTFFWLLGFTCMIIGLLIGVMA